MDKQTKLLVVISDDKKRRQFSDIYQKYFADLPVIMMIVKDLPQRKDEEVTVITDELATVPITNKKKPMPYYHGKRRW